MHTHTIPNMAQQSEETAATYSWNTSDFINDLTIPIITKVFPSIRIHKVDNLETFNRMRTVMVRVEKTGQLLSNSIVPQRECCNSRSDCCSTRVFTRHLIQQLEILSWRGRYSLCYCYSESFIQQSTNKRCAFINLIFLDTASPRGNAR